MIKPGAVSPPVPSPLLNVSELLRCCEGSGQQPPADMHSLLQAISLFTPLLNTLGDMVFFIKDRHARYLIANQTLARRCGFKSVAPLLGKTCAEVFPQRLGHLFTEQDHQVLHTGRHLQDRLELHLYSGRKTGWCLTQKLPLRNQQREVIGIAGISQDLQEIRRGQRAYPGLCALEYYLPAFSPANRHEGADPSHRAVSGADRTLLQAGFSSHATPDDPPYSYGACHHPAGKPATHYRYCSAVWLYRSQCLQPSVQGDDRLNPARLSRRAGQLILIQPATCAGFVA